MASEKKTINEILGISMEKIKEMADTSAIIGNPITTPDGSVKMVMYSACKLNKQGDNMQP